MTLTASISLRAFHCSYGTPRCSAVWMLRHSWLVQTFRSFSCCSSTNRARADENYSRQSSSHYHLVFIMQGLLKKKKNVSADQLEALMLSFVPVCHEVRGQRHPPAFPSDCLCSPRADTSRWFGAGRGCSSSSKRSCSECDPGCG